MCQSLYACVTARARSLSSAPAKRRPEKDGNDGKQMEARTPPALMSFTRSWTSQQPRRISSKDVVSIPYSSRGQHGLEDLLGSTEPTEVALAGPDEQLGVRQPIDAVMAVGEGHDVVGVAVPPLHRNGDLAQPEPPVPGEQDDVVDRGAQATVGLR